MSYEIYDKLLNHVEKLQRALNQLRELIKTRIKETQS